MDLRDQLKHLFPDHIEQEISEEKAPENVAIQKTPLVCKYEKKGRNGKPVTLIEDFEGSASELKELSKRIKMTLGIGGSEKDGTIIIQGDNREKIMNLLKEWGYKIRRVGG